MAPALDDKNEMTDVTAHPSVEHGDDHPYAVHDRPSGWKYKQFKIFGHLLPWYASPKGQLALVAFVVFLCPGMFNAISGLGGGGNVNPTAADNMNTALYATFAVFGFFGGSIVNRLGVKITLAFGGLGYCIYTIALLVSVHDSHSGSFNIIAGALLGVCAGLLWTAEGAIMLSYPPEGSKGRYFAWFWAIFNFGAVIGALIPLGQNIHVTSNKTVTDGTYIAFIILMFIGPCIGLFICNAGDIYREDGSRVIMMKHPTWKTELIGLWETLRDEPLIILLFPMFWSSNWFTTYQFNGINNAYFDTRTKALNSVFYWLAQIVGALIVGYCLDIERIGRRLRARVLWAFLFLLTMAVWGGGYAFAKTYTREDAAATTWVPADWNTDGYAGKVILYIMYGFYDAAFQASVYWLMGALSNNSRRVANYVGFYKGIQSAGAAVMWSLDSHKLSFMSEFISNWVLLAGSLLLAAPVIFFKIQDHVPVEADLKFSDETLAEVTGMVDEKTVSV